MAKRCGEYLPIQIEESRGFRCVRGFVVSQDEGRKGSFLLLARWASTVDLFILTGLYHKERRLKIRVFIKHLLKDQPQNARTSHLSIFSCDSLWKIYSAVRAQWALPIAPNFALANHWLSELSL